MTYLEFYVIGCVVAFLIVLAWRMYKYYKRGKGCTVGDLLNGIVICFLSWFSVVICIGVGVTGLLLAISDIKLIKDVDIYKAKKD